MAGGISARRVARWNGSEWSPLGSGMNDDVQSLTVDGSGDLIAGGFFSTAGGVSANRVARWDGSAWSPLGEGFVNFEINSVVHALTVDGSGDLIAGGDMRVSGLTDLRNVARWVGQTSSSNTRSASAARISPANAACCGTVFSPPAFHTARRKSAPGVRSRAGRRGGGLGRLGRTRNGAIRSSAVVCQRDTCTVAPAPASCGSRMSIS